MVSYLPLWETLSRLGVSKTFLAEAAGITPSTMARFSRNENVSLTTIEKICETLNVQIEDVVMRENQGSHAPPVRTPDAGDRPPLSR